MTSQREGLYEQLSKHRKDPEAYTNIFPLDDWTLSEYKVFMEFIHKGWLIQGDDYDKHYNGFIINPEWEGEPMWEEEEEVSICQTANCGNEISTIGWSEGDATRCYCEECYREDQEEEEMDINTKFGLMMMAKSVIEERTGTKLSM